MLRNKPSPAQAAFLQANSSPASQVLEEKKKMLAEARNYVDEFWATGNHTEAETLIALDAQQAIPHIISECYVLEAKDMRWSLAKKRRQRMSRRL